MKIKRNRKEKTWFNGLKFAESVVKEKGFKSLSETLRETENIPHNEFDIGMKDYYHYYRDKIMLGYNLAFGC